MVGTCLRRMIVVSFSIICKCCVSATYIPIWVTFNAPPYCLPGFLLSREVTKYIKMHTIQIDITESQKQKQLLNFACWSSYQTFSQDKCHLNWFFPHAMAMSFQCFPFTGANIVLQTHSIFLLTIINYSFDKMFAWWNTHFKNCAYSHCALPAACNISNWWAIYLKQNETKEQTKRHSFAAHI